MSWGYFKIGKFHKNKRDETFEKATAGRLDIVLTTYETLRNHWVIECTCLVLLYVNSMQRMTNNHKRKRIF